MFGKSIQKLRTNSRNLYEIEDPNFRMLYVALSLLQLTTRNAQCLVAHGCDSFANGNALRSCNTPCSEHLRPEETNKEVVATCVRKCGTFMFSASDALFHSYLHMPCGLLRGALHSFGILTRCISPPLALPCFLNLHLL